MTSEGKRGLAQRFKEASVKKKVNFFVLALLCLLFVLWSGNLWVLLLIPVFAEMYLFEYVQWRKVLKWDTLKLYMPWNAWRDSESGLKRMLGRASYTCVKTIAEWTDAIVFALFAVYFINIYFFQNYQIPTSSLEKSLLVGDYLFVSKLSYGPRSPMTPLSFPLAQHTLPVLNCKSYIEKPQWEYNRLKGFGNVKHNDIVVFNFPAGDTVAEKMQNVDYYSLVERFGRDYVWNNPDRFGEIVTRPVDRRENYVKRAVALPGDVLELKNGALYLNGVKQNDPDGLQFNYFVETTSFYDEKMFSALGISKDDRMLISQGSSSADSLLLNLGYRRTPSGHFNFIYHFPMTKSALAKLKAMDRGLVSVTIESDSILDLGKVFPYKLDNGWTRDNFGPIWMPKKGETVDLDLNNIAIYEQIIRNYELNTLEVKDRQIFINGAPASSYTFKMDYYWMMGDNRHNSSDSRYWGFVPEDHIVGKPIFVWMSIDKDKSGLSSVRTERIFKKIHD